MRVVRDAGERAGKEVVQLHVHDAEARLEQPEQELKAFAKVQLGPSEAKTVRFRLGPEAFRYHDPDSASWIVEPGEFDVRVGHSSRDIRVRAALMVSEAKNGEKEWTDAISSSS